MTASDAPLAGRAPAARRRRPDEGVQALRRRLDQLAETQRWVHHVADLDTGQVLTTALRRPVTPLSRAQRLSRLGHHFDTSIFGQPQYELTPRRPFQSAPLAHLSATAPSFYGADADEIVWQLPAQEPPRVPDRHVKCFFAESPVAVNQHAVVSLTLTGRAFKGRVGHVRVHVVESLGNDVLLPITDTFAAHTLDVTLIPLARRQSTVFMEIEAGVELLTFTKITFVAEPPVLNPGTL
jgi:hypothetical protein